MNLQTFKPIAFTVSLAGLLLLLWINVSLLLGKPAPIELSFANIFFVLFPLWAFTVYYLKTSRPLLGEEGLKQMTALQKIRYFLGNPPVWAMVLLAGFYGYSLYSLFLYMSGGITDPEFVDGQYQVYNHGKIILYSEAEYQVLHKTHLLSETGFFLAFFAVSTVALAPWRRSSPLPEA